MKTSEKRGGREGDDTASATMDAARSLGRTIGETSAFKRFEIAFESFCADADAQRRLTDHRTRQLEVQQAATWGGADPSEERRLEEEWAALLALPVVHDYVHAEEHLTSLLREAAERISRGVGMDFGAACAPAGGCC
ncbi:YlbF family regulator [Anaeromyxobacter sp. PSR-1]|uniref:YlbF family regulator n=1 Tax=Anaeromyxobacter sp. PSR-1 TaxID=1300915 RepID=UPI0005DC757C|nr:YlbF family regulator [Anaeromyxobacter sp. PSR-1]GAO01256.1 hypothetical protein PSR1_00109 [Anaeromyxobacter sp. PSR-1]